MNNIVQKLIDRAIKSKATFLDLGNCHLTSIPKEILSLPSTVKHISFGTYSVFNKNHRETMSSLQNKFTDHKSFELLLNIKHVTKLEFHDCKIDEHCLAHIIKLQHLTHLNVSGCRIANAVKLITNLSNLTSLSITNNEIEDSGIESISSLLKLDYLDVSSNNIGIGIHNIKRLTNLSHLKISYNKLGSVGTESISTLLNLTQLDIGHNNIGAAGAKNIANLSKLNILRLSGNNIGDEGMAEIGRLSELNNLDIEQNKIEMNGTKNLSRLSKLTSLNIDENNIGDGGAEIISALSKLTSLNIAENNIHEAGVENIGRLSQLTSLTVDRNKIGDVGAESISSLSQLTSLNINENNIGDNGARSISKLSKLTSLHIQKNNISEAGATSLSKLSKLNFLFISDNKLGDDGAKSISKLSKLNFLLIDRNNIGDQGIKHLSKLSRLVVLLLSGNKIGDNGAKSLAKLSKLNFLLLRNNNINHAKHFKSFKKIQHLILTNNPIKDVPESITEGYNDTMKDLRIWWKETADVKKTKLNKTVKLQIIGNGNAGKSSIIEALKNGSCQKQFKSTHGIVIDELIYKLETDEIIFNVWDFGGQEIYHGTHNLFIASQSIHVLVADDESEQLAHERKKIPDRDNPEEEVLHQPLQHYINLSRRRSPRSTRVIVKNKVDDEKTETNTSLYSISKQNNIDFLNISATKGAGIDELRKILAKKRNDVLEFKMPMPSSWLDVRQYLINNLSKPELVRTRLINLETFDEICKLHKVSDYSKKALLAFLHHQGIIYQHEELLKDVIITDQKWALDAIYKPLDRKSIFYNQLRNEFKGRVQVMELFKAFGDSYIIEHKWLFLNFMRSCGLCFPLYKKGSKETVDHYYIFPEFLPENATPAVVELWSMVSDVKKFTYKLSYLDYYRIQTFIVELGNKTAVEYIWRSGILVVTDKGKFRVEADTGNPAITIHIESSAIDEYLWRIIETFETTKDAEEKINWLDEDGKVLDLESLRKKNRSSGNIFNEISSGIHVPQTNEKKTTDLKTSLPNVEQANPKRLVISFASDNLGELRHLESSLSAYEHNGSLQIQYDSKVITGRDSWDNDIQEMFMKADGYIMLVSIPYQDYKKHPYIWNNEIPIIKKRNSENKVFAYCISVSPVKYNEILNPFAAYKGGTECLPQTGHSRDSFLIDFAETIIENKFLK